MSRWRWTRKERRLAAIVGALALLTLIAFTSSQQHGYSRRHQRDLQTTHASFLSPFHSQQIQLWRSLYGSILSNHPRCEKLPELIVPREERIVFNPDHEHTRPDVLWMDDADVARMRSAHASFIKDIKVTATQLVYDPGTRGIVITASESLLGNLAISLHMLRKTGTNLHVEVFLENLSEYAVSFCTNVLRPLRAECRFLSDVLGSSGASVTLHSFQHKVFSIIFSSFEDVLLLDSDAWPVTDPEPLFHSLPFTDTGMILWPDFWYASESPYFFDIAKITKVPSLSARPASESGELMYSKSKHSLSLMLAAYYNFYGPDYYYLLQSQGGPGQGDKDTFIWAATAMHEDFYFVKQAVGSLGRHNINGEYIGTGMIQHDPVEDFLQNAKMPFQKPIKDSSEIAHPIIQKPPTNPPRPLFIHANHPKLDPYTILRESENELGCPSKNDNGEWTRCWMPYDDAVILFGTDIEKSFWAAMEEAVCGNLLTVWQAFGRSETGAPVSADQGPDTCSRVHEYQRAVFGEQV